MKIEITWSLNLSLIPLKNNYKSISKSSQAHLEIDLTTYYKFGRLNRPQ